MNHTVVLVEDDCSPRQALANAPQVIGTVAEGGA